MLSVKGAKHTNVERPIYLLAEPRDKILPKYR